MSTATATPPTTTTYEIAGSEGNFYILVNGFNELRDSNGFVRYFTTRNSARKRIARERSGNFHK